MQPLKDAKFLYNITCFLRLSYTARGRVNQLSEDKDWKIRPEKATSLLSKDRTKRENEQFIKEKNRRASGKVAEIMNEENKRGRGINKEKTYG